MEKSQHLDVLPASVGSSKSYHWKPLIRKVYLQVPQPSKKNVAKSMWEKALKPTQKNELDGGSIKAKDDWRKTHSA